MSGTEPELRWHSAARTDVGTVRRVNEDAFLDQPLRGLWAVADGMGGHDAGDFASQTTVGALGAIEPPPTLGGFVQVVREQLQEVNQRLRHEARRRHKEVIGTTVAVLLAQQRHGVYLWAGDSRIYLFRDGHLEQLSRDHSHVEELVARGLLRPEEALNHPGANVITRAVGGTEALEVDAEILELRGGERFLLCSDGLNKAVGDADIARLLAGADCEPVAQALVDLALARGARDNVTVVVVQVDAAAPPTA